MLIMVLFYIPVKIDSFHFMFFFSIEILYVKIFIITKYCPISNCNVNIVVTDMNDI